MTSARVHLQRLIGALILLLGITCALASYVLLSWLANKEIEQNAQKIAKQVELELGELLLPPTALLNLLANVPDLKTGRLSDWIDRLPAQGSLLRANDMLESVYIGGPDGQYLSLRRIKNQKDRQAFSIDDHNVAWLVQAQRADGANEEWQLWLGLDDQFVPLTREMEPWTKDYDPRLRPWYGAAIDAPHIIRTEPYKFFTSGRDGVTLARDMGSGYVVAMDISLDSLGPRLRDLASKWSARLWLLDQNLKLIVGDHQKSETDPLATYANGRLPDDLLDGGWVRDAGGESWWLGSSRFHVDGRSDMDMRYAFPRTAVLGKAEMVRDMLLGVTALMLAIVLMATRQVSLRISRPIEALARASERVGKLDFEESINIRSDVSEVRQLADEYERMRAMLFENQNHLVTANATLQARLEDLKNSQTELARSNAELEQIAYAAAHDLREPLRMVALYVSLLDKRYASQLDKDGKEFITFARQGAERANRLILDLLDLSEIGLNADQLGPCSLSTAVKEAWASLSSRLGNAMAVTSIAEDLPVVIGNATELRRLMTNLLDNALRYQHPGSVPRISIGWRQVEPSLVEVWIEDNGIGIESIYYDRIFHMFERLHINEAYGGGSGIGLTIGKKIVERHGGHIHVDSTPGQGTKVSFTLKSS